MEHQERAQQEYLPTRCNHCGAPLPTVDRIEAARPAEVRKDGEMTVLTTEPQVPTIKLKLPGDGVAHKFCEADPWTTITVTPDGITFDMELRNPHRYLKSHIAFDNQSEALDFALFFDLLLDALRDNKASLEENPEVVRSLINFFDRMCTFLQATNLSDEEWSKRCYGSREDALADVLAEQKEHEDSEDSLYAIHENEWLAAMKVKVVDVADLGDLMDEVEAERAIEIDAMKFDEAGTGGNPADPCDLDDL